MGNNVSIIDKYHNNTPESDLDKYGYTYTNNTRKKSIIKDEKKNSTETMNSRKLSVASLTGSSGKLSLFGRSKRHSTKTSHSSSCTNSTTLSSNSNSNSSYILNSNNELSKNSKSLIMKFHVKRHNKNISNGSNISNSNDYDSQEIIEKVNNVSISNDIPQLELAKQISKDNYLIDQFDIGNYDLETPNYHKNFRKVHSTVEKQTNILLNYEESVMKLVNFKDKLDFISDSKEILSCSNLQSNCNIFQNQITEDSIRTMSLEPLSRQATGASKFQEKQQSQLQLQEGSPSRKASKKLTAGRLQTSLFGLSLIMHAHVKENIKNSQTNTMEDEEEEKVRIEEIDSNESCASAFDIKKHSLLDSNGNSFIMNEVDGIYKYLESIFIAAELTYENVLITLIYLERILSNDKFESKLSENHLTRIILGAILIASKVWDDHAIWNVDFCQIFEDLDMSDMSLIERTTLYLLEWDTNILIRDYAKFDLLLMDVIRSKLVNLGAFNEALDPISGHYRRRTRSEGLVNRPMQKDTNNNKSRKREVSSRKEINGGKYMRQYQSPIDSFDIKTKEDGSYTDNIILEQHYNESNIDLISEAQEPTTNEEELVFLFNHSTFQMNKISSLNDFFQASSSHLNEELNDGGSSIILVQ